MALFNNFPYSNTEEINLDYTLNKLNELYSRGENLYAELQAWKTETDEANEAWKSDLLSDINEWQNSVTHSLEEWKTSVDSEVTNALTTLSNQITTELAQAKADLRDEVADLASAAAASAADAAASAADAAASQSAAAQSAQSAINSAAAAAQSEQAIVESAEQIEINKNDISDIKSAITEIDGKTGYTQSLDIASGVIVPYIINVANDWYTQSNYPARSSIMQLPDGCETITITTQQGSGCFYALLRTFTQPLVSGADTDGYGRVWLEANTTTTIQIPTDVHYLYEQIKSATGADTQSTSIAASKNPIFVSPLDLDNVYESVTEYNDPKFLHYRGTDSTKDFGFFAVKRGNRIRLSCNFDSFDNIRLGYRNANNGDNDYVDLTSTTVTVHTPEGDVTESHGISLTGEVFIDLYNDLSKLYVSVESIGGNPYQTEINWTMGYRKPFYTITNGTYSEVDFSFGNDDINNDIWIFGDSYINYSASFWMYYLVNNNFTNNCLINGYAGCPSVRGAVNFDNLIALAKPEYIVWALGMNDGSDSSIAPSNAWQTGINHIKDVCDANKIKLVLCTIPTVPSVNNEKKNEYIRNSGLPYIDFAKAVGASASGTWYTGTMSQDNVHTNATGAKLLYNKALIDFPVFCAENG